MSVYLIQGETLTLIADVVRAFSGYPDQIPGKNIAEFMGGAFIDYYYAVESFVDIIEGNPTAGPLPNGLTKIKDYAFMDCTNLELVILPDRVTSIGSEAFVGCTNLRLTSLPDGVTSIGSAAFMECVNLRLTSLPEGLTSIEDDTFAGCINLALTSLPESLTSIGDHAFDSCTLLEEITFKGTPSSISSFAFYGCTNLTTINVPWAEGEVANAPWGATNATINYTGTGGGVS